MKIGELFIALGFQIKGQKDFDDVEAGLQKSAINAGKLTIAVNAINVALLAMLDTAGKAGMALRNFAVTTGLSTDELQRWQHAAVVNGVSADELTSGIKRLQDARTAFAFNEPQAVGAWSLLGVNPLQDPFKVISDLRAALVGVQPLIARGLLSRVGLENLAPLIQAPKSDFEKWSRDFLVSSDQIARLARLNAAWESLKRSFIALKNLAAAALAPAFTALARILEWLTSKAAALADWLQKGGVVATAVRWALSGLAIGLVVLGAFLAVVTAALAALTAGFAILSPAVLAVLPELAVFLGYAAAIAAVLAGLVLIVDDIVTSLSGGKAVTRTIGEWLAGFTLVREVIEGIWRTWDEAVLHFKEGIELFAKLFSKLPTWMLGVRDTPDAISNAGAAWYAPRPQNGGAGGTWRQENTVQVHVDGARSPEATARAVGSELRASLAGAAYQMPVPNY